MAIDITQIKYPRFSNIMNLHPDPARLLGEEIVWESKEDGSNIGIYLDEDGNIRIRNRNRDEAHTGFYNSFAICEEATAIEELLRDAEQWNTEYVVFAELCKEGMAPARSTIHDKTHLVVFDIWSSKYGWYIPYTLKYQRCYQFGIPCVDCYGITRSITLEELLETKEEMLARAKSEGKEGVVGKVWNPVNKIKGNESNNRWVIFKEKLDTPKFEKLKRITSGEPRLPPLEESEIYSAINAIRIELGSDFFNVRIAMPKVATAINDEMKKHFRSKPPEKLFVYYRRVVEDARLVEGEGQMIGVSM